MWGVDGSVGAPRRSIRRSTIEPHTSPTAVRALTALAAASLLLAPAAAVAQTPPAQPPVASYGPDPLATLGTTALRPGSWTYRSTVERGGATVELGRRTLTVRATEHDGAPAWLILDETRARGQAMTDSLVVTGADLRPVRRVADMGPMRIVLAFPGDTIRGTMAVPGAEPADVLLTVGERRVVVNAGMLETVLPLLPLAAGWTATIAQLTPSPLGAAVVPLRLTVTGEASVTVPAGTFDAWLLTASAAGAEQRMWLAKDTGRLLRQEASPPTSDVVYRTELVEIGAPR